MLTVLLIVTIIHNYYDDVGTDENDYVNTNDNDDSNTQVDDELVMMMNIIIDKYDNIIT